MSSSLLRCYNVAIFILQNLDFKPMDQWLYLNGSGRFMNFILNFDWTVTVSAFSSDELFGQNCLLCSSTASSLVLKRRNSTGNPEAIGSHEGIRVRNWPVSWITPRFSPYDITTIFSFKSSATSTEVVKLVEPAKNQHSLPLPMVQFYDDIPPFLIDWIKAQHVFWVATAPLSADGHINVSGKGVEGTFHVVDNRQVWYEDLTGSGWLTIELLHSISHI